MIFRIATILALVGFTGGALQAGTFACANFVTGRSAYDQTWYGGNKLCYIYRPDGTLEQTRAGLCAAICDSWKDAEGGSEWCAGWDENGNPIFQFPQETKPTPPTPPE
jgi:hypothetical protein